MSNILDITGGGDCNGCKTNDCCCDEYSHQRIELNSLPITGVLTGTSSLIIDFVGQSSNIDLTGNLPTTMDKGSRIVIRKLNSTQFIIGYNDGYANYTFIDKYSEYIELYYDGINWHI